jgi:hypothetical protein
MQKKANHKVVRTFVRRIIIIATLEHVREYYRAVLLVCFKHNRFYETPFVVVNASEIAEGPDNCKTSTISCRTVNKEWLVFASMLGSHCIR